MIKNAHIISFLIVYRWKRVWQPASYSGKALSENQCRKGIHRHMQHVLINKNKTCKSLNNMLPDRGVLRFRVNLNSLFP